MSIEWIEGWRYRGGATELATDYTIAGAGTLAVAELTARRAGCYAATLTTKTVQRAISLTFGARAIVEFAYVWGGTNASNICLFMEGATVHCSLGITSGGVLTAYRGDNSGTSLGTGATLTAGTVYHLSIDATVNDSTGAITVYVDDVSSIALTSQDTRQTGTPTIDAIKLEGQATGDKFADIVIIDPSNAAGRTTKLGKNMRVDCRIPIANGAKADCTPNTGTNYAAVDDDGFDSDTTYVQSQVAGARDLYSVTQMTHNPSTVYACQVHVVAKKADSASRSIKPVVRTSDGTTTPGNAVALTTSYASIVDLYEDNGALDDGGTWTQQAFNGRQFGFEIV